MLWNQIARVCFYFFSTDRNFEHFSPLRNGSERNSESFLFHGMVQNGIPRVCFYFCSMVQNSENSSPLRNGSERNSESFMFRGTAGIPPEQTNCSVYSFFRGIIFLSEGASKTPYTIIHPNQRPLRSPKQQRIKTAKSRPPRSDTADDGVIETAMQKRIHRHTQTHRSSTY
jgi:hypothetical protein